MDNSTESPVEGYRFLFNGDRFTFAMCGLDIHRNCLQSPRDPYGEKAILGVENNEGLQEFVINVLETIDCDQCGVFVIYNNGDVLCAIKGYDDYGDPAIDGYRMQFPFGQINYCTIGEVAIEECLYLYGLMVEVEDNGFEIIER